MDLLPVGDQAPDPSVRAVAALDDMLRRRMYEFIRDAGNPVTREQVATATGVSRKLAAFHLDKLVEVGLLAAGYEPAGRIRRIGRAPKVYEPAGLDVRVSIPARHYETLAAILIDAALSEDGGEPTRRAAVRVARGRGEEAGARLREQARPGRLGAERALSMAEGALREWGLEPRRDGHGGVRLRNCPFHPLAGKAPDLVCGINLGFAAGLLDGLQARAVEAAVVAPRAGECCVELRPAPAAERAGY
jgi:predicted ArsR family transcriptional regulator